MTTLNAGEGKARGLASAQWAAFNQVLHFLNTIETREVAKKDIYAAVMEMRPRVDDTLLPAVLEAYTAMRIASSLPPVAAEYDFAPALASLQPLLDSLTPKDPNQ